MSMVKAAIKVLSCLLLVQQLTTPSLAQSDLPDLGTQLLLQRLDALANPSLLQQQRALSPRTFAVRVQTTVLVSSLLPHDFFCTASLSHGGVGASYSESKGKRFENPGPGKSFVCDIFIPVSWSKADDERTVSVFVSVRALSKDLTSLPDDHEYSANRSSSQSLTPIPLPAQNETAIVTAFMRL
jgi:hypothetical protein